MPGAPHGHSVPDKVMAAALGQTARSGGPDCLDPEELAAYYERSLHAHELVRAEAHVASCLACQERLIALMRIEPTPAPKPSWWRAWIESPRRWAWAAPALAAGLAVAVWLATRPASVPVPELTIASKLGGSEQDTARQKASEETSTVAAPITAEKSKPTSPVELPPVGGSRAEPKRETLKQDVAAEAPPPPAGVVAGKVGPARERAAKGDERIAKEGAAVAERRAEIVAGPAFALAARGILPVVLPAPGGRIVWRLDATGAIARSDDGGKVWRDQVPAGFGLTAGSVVSEQVCWAVGRGGAVLRTEDGERWERVTAPAPVDLLGIEATDALHAQVTASDGRRFETTDGGKTWVLRQQASG